MIRFADIVSRTFESQRISSLTLWLQIVIDDTVFAFLTSWNFTQGD
ncbi:hypothetical protein JIY74_23540 [Vibrio harveyi]|nr:hypothetical protein [Vibrio harveyi]